MDKDRDAEEKTERKIKIMSILYVPGVLSLAVKRKILNVITKPRKFSP